MMIESLVGALDVAVYVCFAVAMVALPFFFVNALRAVRSMPPLASPGLRASGMPFKSTLFFVVPIVATFLLSAIIGAHAKNEALRFLEALPHDHIVLVNGQRASAPEPILVALKGVHSVMAHHSHSTTAITVDVQTSSQHLRLVLGRDSQNPNEYWVYDARYRATSNNEIGRIVTDIFRAY